MLFCSDLGASIRRLSSQFAVHPWHYYWTIRCRGSYDIFYDHIMRSIGFDKLIGDERSKRSAVINDGRGINTEVVNILEGQFATQDRNR